VPWYKACHPVDANGIVRYYHPGAVPEAELAARIDALVKR
jgi:hypothetical protein